MDSKNYFNRIAGQWDEMRKNFFSDNVREMALKKAGVVPGGMAADIGAGTGFITEALVKRGVSVVAVDQSESMTAELKAKFSTVTVRTGNAENIPIKDETADYVFANMCLHHVETPLNAVKEMVRILKTGGILVITDLDQHQFEFLRTEHHDRWLGFKRDHIKAWFNEAHLKNISIESLDENCCTTSECSCQNAAASIFMAAGMK
jgi:ubiquinone/menaquinone biosynthesis C-methylase UbiE